MGPHLKEYNIVIIKPKNYVHSDAFIEIAETLMYGLHSNGIIAKISTNEILPKVKNIILGAHLINHTSISDIPADAIVYNFEQLYNDSVWMSNEYISLLKTYQVWEYSKENIEYLKTLKPLFEPAHVPLGFTEQMGRIEKADNQDIDVLFYGSINYRRKVILENLKKSGLNVIHLFGVYGAERDSYISRSKIILNVHAHKTNIFEIVRISYLLSNRKAVVSELSPGSKVDSDVKGGLIFAEYDGLVEACRSLVSDDSRRSEVEIKGFSAFSSRKEKLILEKVLSKESIKHTSSNQNVRAFRHEPEKALVLTNHLCDMAGSEILALEVAETFSKLGYSTEISANLFGGHAVSEVNNSNFNFIDSPNIFDYDVVWMQHLRAPLCLSDTVPEKMPRCIFSAHLSPYEPFEHVGINLAKNIGAILVANSAETAEYLQKIYNIKNVVNFENSCPSRFGERLTKPRKILSDVLIVSNHPSDEWMNIIRLAKNYSIKVDHIGVGGKYITRVTPELLGKYDAIITIGKTVQYALVGGRPVYVYDRFGGPGYLNQENFEASAAANFSGRCCNIFRDAETILKDLIDGYKSALEFSQKKQNDFTKRYDLERFIKFHTDNSQKKYDSQAPLNMLGHLIAENSSARVIRQYYCTSVLRHIG